MHPNDFCSLQCTLTCTGGESSSLYRYKAKTQCAHSVLSQRKGPSTPSVTINTVNAVMTLATYLSLKKIELLQNGLQSQSGVTLIVSIDFNESYVASVMAALTQR